MPRRRKYDRRARSVPFGSTSFGDPEVVSALERSYRGRRRREGRIRRLLRETVDVFLDGTTFRY